MIPKIIGTLGTIFSGKGLDFPLDEKCNEKEGGILLVFGALLPMALKALPLILGVASIAHTVNQK